MTEPRRSPHDALRLFRFALGFLRVLVVLWCCGWVFISLFGMFMLDRCTSYVVAPATCEQTILVAWIALVVAQLVTLVVALVFSASGRRERTQAIALTLGAIAPIVLIVVFYQVSSYAGREAEQGVPTSPTQSTNQLPESGRSAARPQPRATPDDQANHLVTVRFRSPCRWP
jgi:hypothetical protein